MAAGHAKCVGGLDNVFVYQPYTQVGQPDHGYDGVKNNGNAIEFGFSDTEQEDKRNKVNERRQRLQHIQYRNGKTLHHVAPGHRYAYGYTDQNAYKSADKNDGQGLHRVFVIIYEGQQYQTACHKTNQFPGPCDHKYHKQQ